MTGIEVAVIALGFAGMAGFSSLAMHFAQRRAARRAQAELLLPDLAARLQPSDVGLKVKVLGDTGPGQHGTSFVIDGICNRLTLYRHGDVPPAPELETGDPEFDATFFVLGPPTLVHAMLDTDTRRILRALAGYGPEGAVSVAHGQLRVDIPLSANLHPSAVDNRGREAVALGRRLLKPDDVVQRLADNAQRDPVAAVRLANLNAAIREAPDDPATLAALRAATADVPEIRLRAGLALGARGRDALLSLIEGHSVSDAIKAAAVHGLGAEAPEELLMRVLRRSVGAQLASAPHEPRAAQACVAALALSRSAEAVSLLQGLLLANAVLGPDAARALGRMGGDDAEAALIGALHGDVFESRLAAAEVLGEVGTTGAVPALREAERHGVEMRRVARQAIAEIQARATEAPGAVSLAGAQAGQVSVVDDPAGQVSLPGPARSPGA